MCTSLLQVFRGFQCFVHIYQHVSRVMAPFMEKGPTYRADTVMSPMYTKKKSIPLPELFYIFLNRATMRVEVLL